METSQESQFCVNFPQIWSFSFRSVQLFHTHPLALEIEGSNMLPQICLPKHEPSIEKQKAGIACWIFLPSMNYFILTSASSVTTGGKIWLRNSLNPKSIQIPLWSNITCCPNGRHSPHVIPTSQFHLTCCPKTLILPPSIIHVIKNLLVLGINCKHLVMDWWQVL